MQNKKGGLGRGLDALFNDNSTDRNDLIEVKLIDIEPNKEQPRKTFDEKALSELADSIREHGLLQPIIVKPLTNGTYRIIAGERRWRASRIAGLETVPVIIKDFDDKEVMEVALIENLQREDLNPVEEAMGYRSLMDTFGMTQEQVAERVGKSRSAVANALRLLNLRPQELELLKLGKITAGHARALLSAADALTREEMLEKALNGASVHDLERIARASQKRKGNREPSMSGTGFYAEVELALKEALHRKVKVTKLGEDHGAITIEFFGDEELRDIAAKLGKMY
ncbi:MAG: ParB/RepB/Spo0J family partition protein [Acutalibacteraceae bacterium]|nr:ParB/RepB/Spo0J family partition protein [Clostridia bacterium]MEE1198557.1 ParB/RepB/Spo0J family partition protein [Acutalibacteraceae bacterium]